MIQLSRNFVRFKKFEYAIEVLEGSMDMMEILEDKVQAKAIFYLIYAYIECGEFLKAKAVHMKRRSAGINDCSAGWQPGRIEAGLCNYETASDHYREVVDQLQKQEHDGDRLSGTRCDLSAGLATSLLKHSAANEDEAFTIFQEELNRFVDPLRREIILFKMGTWYRKLSKWDQSIETLRRICRRDGTILSQANQAMAQTYLEQYRYCTDNTLTTDQRTQILRHVTDHSLQVDECSTEMHLTQAQLFYFNGDK